MQGFVCMFQEAGNALAKESIMGASTYLGPAARPQQPMNQIGTFAAML